MLNFNKFDDVSEILLEYRLNVPYLLCAVGNLQESATSNLSQQEEEGRASWARWDGCTANKLAERAHICLSLRCITTFASTLTCWKLEPVLWKNGLKMQLASKLAYCYYIMQASDGFCKFQPPRFWSKNLFHPILEKQIVKNDGSTPNCPESSRGVRIPLEN